jgi:predicted lactoylglutathione lyase
VSVDWPVAYKQAFSVGPFYQLIDSQTISVSRKAEQVIITLGKKQRMRWDQLTTNKEEFEQARLNPKDRHGHAYEEEASGTRQTECLAAVPVETAL